MPLPSPTRNSYQNLSNPSRSSPNSNSFIGHQSVVSSRSSNSPYDYGPPQRPFGHPHSRSSTPSQASWTSGSLGQKLTLPPDPTTWNSGGLNDPEADDALHDPRISRLKADSFFSFRGIVNVGCLTLLLLALMMLFIGYPVLTAFRNLPQDTLGGYNLGGVNASGQIPDVGNWGLIDKDTPADAYEIDSFTGDGKKYQLIFSDEFNIDGRTFYPGDDPYWEAVDLHYWQTNNIEWYDPEAIKTENGYMEITLERMNIHDLNYRGGMVSTWNKFCFTGGIILSSVTLPGSTNVHGLWPAIWTMGNLGRAGYGASLEGMWPYSYDACDVGVAPNQTINGQPAAALTDGDDSANDELSWLPGQKLSRCVCDGESHPGPKHTDGSYVGRAAPEIDIFEAQVESEGGAVSQSAQWAPFNHGYIWLNTSDNFQVVDESKSHLNSYIGGSLQQATSVVSLTNQNCYELTGGCFTTYGFQYKPGFEDAYISWINDGSLAWTIRAGGMAADPIVQISDRPVPQEPMYIIMNLGMSRNFGAVELDRLTFPTSMKIDWVRVYQEDGQQNYGCNPKDFPTTDYINQHLEAYTNANLTTWRDDYGQPFPRNSAAGDC